jgi:hypothetical protein
MGASGDDRNCHVVIKAPATSVDCLIAIMDLSEPTPDQGNPVFADYGSVLGDVHFS